MDLNKKLEELKPYQLNCNVFDVYSYNGLSMQDLLCQFFTKINECITVSNETIDLAKWLVNEGLEIEVVKKLMIWLEDGTLENIINVNLFNTLNEKINGLSSQLEQNMNKVNEQFNTIEKVIDLFIEDYKEFVVGDNWDNAFIKVFEDAKKVGNAVINLSRRIYNVTKEFPVLDFNVKIKGIDNSISIIKYLPSTEGTTLIKSLWTNDNAMYPLYLDNITIIQGNNVANTRAILHAKTSFSSPGWGGRIKCVNCRFMNFTKEHIKVYAPFNTVIEGCSIKGNGFARSSNPMIPTKSEVGILFTGQEKCVIETFGNMNKISNCLIYEIAYPIRGIDVGSTTIENCTFDPSFVALNFYSNSSATGYADNITVNNCWFESYNGQCHPKFSAYCCYEIDFKTGDLKQPLSNKANIILNNCKIDWREGFSSDDARMNSKFIYYGNGGYSNSINSEIEDSDRTIFRFFNNESEYVKFGTLTNYLKNILRLKNGIKKLSKNEKWGYKNEFITEYHKGITPTSELHQIEISLDSETEVTQIKEIIVNCKINDSFIRLKGVIVNNTFITNVENKVLYNHGDELLEIESGIKGGKLEYSSGKLVFKFKATNLNTIDMTIEHNYIRI